MRKIKILFVLLVCQFFWLTMDAQITVTGQVVSADKGQPLSDASVIVSGNSTGTTTDADGKFSINAAVGSKIVFSFIGYETREVVVKGKDHLLVRLDPKGDELGEVIVTALGISREKRALGYSVGEVKGDDMNKVPQENVVNALTGKVAGLKISNTSNDLSSSPQVVIRGIKSLSGNDAPLIVIDGLPTGNDAGVLSDLSADNIASVIVLKGPSAAALYGSRAGSGVLLVTTKNGRGLAKGIGVTFNSSYTASVPYKFVDEQQEFSSGINGLFDPTTQQQWWGPAMGTPAVQWNSNGQAVPLKPHPDNVKNFVNTGNSYINEIGISGSNERGSFNLSMSDTRATGIYPGSEVRKDAVSLSASRNISKTFRVSTNIHLLTSGSDNFRAQADDKFPYEDIYFVPNYIDVNDFRNYWAEQGVQQNVWDKHFNNPWFTAYATLDKFRQFRAYGNAKFDWVLVKSLA
jgi:TonB-dependent SusC/RagA subfamily outer membrane receptor